MKKIKYLLVVIVAWGFAACSNGQSGKFELTADAFSAKIKEFPEAPVVDVRSPEEYAEGHLAGAKNYDWNGNAFNSQTATLDKSKPVFVYCLAGGRSASAAAHMRSKGFKQVYELRGGMNAWRGAGLPESK